MIWNDETIALLRDLHERKYTFTKIYRHMVRLGHDVTRNALIGKARRLGLPKRDHVGFKQGNKLGQLTAKNKDPRCKAKSPRRQKAVVALTPYDAGLIAVRRKGRTGNLVDLDHDQCRWPVTDKGPPYLFCVRNKDGRSPYCADHHKAGVQRR